MTAPRICGPCTECCTVIGVTRIGKPPDQPCPHCVKGMGCTIYSDRPLTCELFQCLWLKGHGGRELRPDKTHAVLVDDASPGLGATVVVHVHPAHPDAPNKEPLKTLLDVMVADGVTVLLRWKQTGTVRAKDPAKVLARLRILGLATPAMGGTPPTPE